MNKLVTLTRGAVVGCALMLLHAQMAFAYSGPGENKKLHLTVAGSTHASSGSASGSIVRTIVGLAIVIAVIYGLSWIMRQAKASKNPTVGTGLTQIATLPMGTNRSVALVRAGTELHLLGIAEQGVTRIRTYTLDEAVAAGLPVGTAEERGERDPSPVIRGLDALRRMTAR